MVSGLHERENKVKHNRTPPHLHKHNSLNKHSLLGEDTVTKTIESAPRLTLQQKQKCDPCTRRGQLFQVRILSNNKAVAVTKSCLKITQ